MGERFQEAAKIKIMDERFQEAGKIKMNLRQHPHIKMIKIIDYDEEEQQKLMQNKSKRYWHKINKKYFKHLSLQDLSNLKNTLNHYHITFTQSLLPFRQQSYFHRNILTKNNKLFERKNIRVLFQDNTLNDGYGDSICLAYYFTIKNNEQQQNQQSYSSYQIIDLENQNLSQNIFNQKKAERINTMNQEDKEMNVMYMKEQNSQPPSQKQIQGITQLLQLNYNKSSSDIDFLTQCNYYDLTKYQFYHTQIDREIDLWQYQLQKIATLNLNLWNNIEKSITQQSQSQTHTNHQLIQEENQTPHSQQNTNNNTEQEVNQIHSFLAWQHNLVNFKNGFTDKNQEMLAEALEGMWIKQHKTKNMGQKKKFFKASIQNLMQTKSQLSNIFETDCKICFSTYVSDKNKVIYCDNCNQSFHQKCYGIQNLNEDPNSKFYCDSCQFLMESGKKHSQCPTCQICHVPYSPLKKIGSSFFHPSCLFLNNLLKPKLGNLQLQQDITSQIIIEKIKQFQSYNQDNECEYCTQNCQIGLRFKCAEPQCTRYFHTICAYLHSCVFKIWRNKEKLETEIRCWQHYPRRDNLRQSYLRRFFCNYKNIADLSENEFIQIYNQELQSIREFKNQLKTNSTTIPQYDIQNSQFHSNSQRRRSKNDELNKSRLKMKKKHKKRQKTISEFEQNLNVIDLNSEEQSNTDYQFEYGFISGKKITINQNQSSTEIKILPQQKEFNSEDLKSHFDMLSNQFTNRKDIHKVTKKESQFIQIQQFMSQIDKDCNPQFNLSSQQSGSNCQTNGSSSYLKTPSLQRIF